MFLCPIKIFLNACFDHSTIKVGVYNGGGAEISKVVACLHVINISLNARGLFIRNADNNV